MSRDLPAGTVTLLYTDIEGSTRLLRLLGAAAYAEALAEHRRLLRGAFATAGGVEVDTQGDAFFVAFASAPAAAAAAAAGQQALEAGQIAVRMGVHTGTPTVTSEGYVGIDVHRGARIAALAHGGQVIVSAATAALLEDEPLRDLGRHRLKDFDAPVQLYQLGTFEFPPLRTPGALDLPQPVTPFLGREREFYAAAAAWLDGEPRLLTITGPGGTGKTRFSIELARFLADDADGGTVFVPLAPVRDAWQILPLVADRLGATGSDAAAIATRIGERRAHVVLDNLEQLLPEAARPLAELLAAAPTLRILATSREALRIGGESEFDLPPMDEADAVTLFLQRAQAVRADVADSDAVHELTRRLDGLPLAIELAAARVKLLAPEQLLERIAQHLDLLKGGRDADERHATLRATIAWSHDLLGPEEQRLFARLAVFRGGATLETVERVCEAELDMLASLLDKSLVRRRSDPDGEERFWMLETIRAFARERLEEAGEEDAVRRRQWDGLIDLAARAGTRAVVNEVQPWDFDLVAPEIDNILAVLDWAVSHDPGRGLQLTTSLESYWVVRDPLAGIAWFERLLAICPDAEPHLRAQALRALGGSLDMSGQSDRAAPCYRESLELLAATRSDAHELAHTRFRVAANMVMRGEEAAAWPLLEEALAESRLLGSRFGEGQAMAFLAQKAYAEGDLELACDLALESADIARAAGWTWWEAGQLLSAAAFERERGRLDEAEVHAQRSFELALALGGRQNILFAAAELAVIAAGRGDAGRAGRIWGALETEAGTGPVGAWEREVAGLEQLVLRAASPEFAAARAQGSLLSVAEAARPDAGGPR